MRSNVLIFLLCLSTGFGCDQGNKRPEPNYYRNLSTNEILDKSDFGRFTVSLHQNIPDSLKGSEHVILHFEPLDISGDSIIQPFNYDIRVGDEYLVRANSFEKIGMKVTPKKLLSMNGDSIQIGGAQSKPMLVNLWFVACRGCVAEIPALNKLQDKYSDSVNFVAMTFDDAEKVKKFLNRKDFNFVHIPASKEFIDYIGTKPYPENIFINKNGYIEYIEGGLGDHSIQYFESLLEKMTGVGNQRL